MTGSSKILTVSYGTFSCTLEGFDDPFDTMRGIAEYFRDLAADDRYFGAEPPTPDVEMLQNIAQREVARRVDARVGETGIALTQSEVPANPTQGDAPKPESVEVEEAETLDSGPLAFDDEYLMADEPEDVLTVVRDAPPATETDRAETVAEKLRRIRAVVSRSIDPEDGSPRSFDPSPDPSGTSGDTPPAARATTQTLAEITAALSEDGDFGSGDDDDTADSEDQNDNLDIDAEADLLDDDIVDEVDIADLERLDGRDVTDPINDTVDAEISTESETASVANVMAEEGTDPGEDDDTNMIANVLSAGHSADDQEDEPADLPPLTLDEGADDEQGEISSSVRETNALTPLSDDDGDVGRLLKETDNQFADDAGIRRRRVISQMRAAVAATKADRVLSRVLTRQVHAEESNAYRDDLKKAITRNPELAAEEPDAAPEPEAVKKPPPLVLVSSQRVDTAMTDDAPDSFEDFVRDMGAIDLPDLMEAAAAYAAFVEGRPNFSRPEIMKRVAQVDPALDVSREAGLRSFGQLLRQGKIKKLERGQFVIDEATRFNPAQRIAGE